MENLCEILEVVSINNEDIKKSVKWGEFKDFEDCLQEICAESIKSDYIVTNNVSDFKMAKINVLTARKYIMHCKQNKKIENMINTMDLVSILNIWISQMT